MAIFNSQLWVYNYKWQSSIANGNKLPEATPASSLQHWKSAASCWPQHASSSSWRWGAMAGDMWWCLFRNLGASPWQPLKAQFWPIILQLCVIPQRAFSEENQEVRFSSFSWSSACFRHVFRQVKAAQNHLPCSEMNKMAVHLAERKLGCTLLKKPAEYLARWQPLAHSSSDARVKSLGSQFPSLQNRLKLGFYMILSQISCQFCKMMPWPRLALSSTLKRYQAAAHILRTRVILFFGVSQNWVPHWLLSIFQNYVHCLGLLGFITCIHTSLFQTNFYSPLFLNE